MALIIAIDRKYNLVQICVEICFEQLRKRIRVIIYDIINHICFLCYLSLCEIKTHLLQMELQHLKRLHHEGTQAIPLLGVCFSTRQEDAFTRYRRCLDGEVVHCNGKKSQKC